MTAVERYAPRIFHTHAKDTEIVAHKRAFLGNQTYGWWRYVIPGYGEIDWGIYVSRLRQKLDEYYRSEGMADPIVMELPKGRFVIVFRPRTSAKTAGQRSQAGRRGRQRVAPRSMIAWV